MNFCKENMVEIVVQKEELAILMADFRKTEEMTITQIHKYLQHFKVNSNRDVMEKTLH